jgi:uncharacterized protein YraI
MLSPLKLVLALVIAGSVIHGYAAAAQTATTTTSVNVRCRSRE